MSDLESTVESLEVQFGGRRVEAQRLRREMRSIRRDLLVPDPILSAFEVERRALLSLRAEELADFEGDLSSRMALLAEIVARVAALADELARLPSSLLSDADLGKVQLLQDVVIDELISYRFSSLDSREIELSEATYLLLHGGFDLGLGRAGGRPAQLQMNASASDGIRLEWAYLAGLLEVSRSVRTNHPGLLILDEPRQQSTDARDFAILLRRLSASSSFGQQMIVGTSEDLPSLSTLVSGLEVKDLRIVDFP